MIEKTLNGIRFIAGDWPLKQDKNTIVFIHGSTNSKMLWESQVKGLSEYANTIALDLPGHGESSGNGMEKVSDYSEVVDEFIKNLNTPNVIPCGLSLGGAITLDLLINSENTFKAGIIVNSGARLKVIPEMLELIKINYETFTANLKTVASSKTDINKLQGVISDAEKCGPEVAYKDFSACNSFDVMDLLGKIKVPVLVLTADEDTLTPEKYGRFMADSITDSTTVQITGSGHLSPVEKPEEVNRAILDFLNRFKT